MLECAHEYYRSGNKRRPGGALRATPTITRSFTCPLPSTSRGRAVPASSRSWLIDASHAPNTAAAGRVVSSGLRASHTKRRALRPGISTLRFLAARPPRRRIADHLNYSDRAGRSRAKSHSQLSESVMDAKKLIPEKQVCQRYGVCDVTPRRWDNDPSLDFPRASKSAIVNIAMSMSSTLSTSGSAWPPA